MRIIFNRWLAHEGNPNEHLQVQYTTQGQPQVILQANRQHHYVFTGKINGVDVDFMLDTGATSVSVPASIAQKLQLVAAYPQEAVTAGGVITVYATRIGSLEIGPITLHNIRAHINPQMHSRQVLLGMSALQELEFSQRNGQMILRQRSRAP